MTSRMDRFRGKRTVLGLSFGILSLAVCPILAMAAGAITGKVIDESTGLPAAGDEVTLLSVGNASAEAARAITDSQGVFVLAAPSSGQYLVRAKHQGVNYEVRVSGSDAVTLQVFDSAPAVEGISGTITIFRLNAARKGWLHVSQMYAIQNQSTPPKTLAGGRAFEIYLPANGSIDSVLAAGPAKIAEKISATSVKGEPGHYTLNFPVRPGETNFAVNYDVPYTGRLAFHPRLVYGVQQLAIMFPQSMKFSSNSASFHPILDKNGFEVQAASQVLAGNAPSFEISGSGALSPPVASSQIEPSRTASSQQSAFFSLPAAINPANASQTAKAGAGTFRMLLESPGASQSRIAWAESLPEPVSLLLLSLVVAAVGVAVFLWRTRKRSSSRSSREDAQPFYSPLEAVKQEFIRLETDRLNGTISLHQYNAHKRMIETSMRRALHKAGAEN